MRIVFLPPNSAKNARSKREQLVRDALTSLNLFDPDWYRAIYPDVAASELDALDHYVRHGDFEARSPHPLFDTQWYYNTYPDVATDGGSAILHYVRYGAAEGRDPSPYFSTRYYASNNPASLTGGNVPLAHFIARWAGDRGMKQREALAGRGNDLSANPHPLFDARWYVLRYDGRIPQGVDPLSYHITTGYRDGLDPHPLIDSTWYRHAYPMRSGNLCTLQDYLQAPWDQVRSPSPLFDRQWYFDTYHHYYDTTVDPLIDYVMSGRAAGRLPHPVFASDWYGRRNPGAKRHPGGPLCHFREVGAAQGADPHPLFSTAFIAQTHPELLDHPCGPVGAYLLPRSDNHFQPHPLFDPRWYVACNPDVREMPIAPLTHLLGYGIWTSRDPHPLFETKWYLGNCPQAQQNFVHPLVHYLEKGSALNLWPTSFFDPEFYTRRYPESAGMDPLIHFATVGMQADHAPNEDAEAMLEGPIVPDVFNAAECNYPRYVRAIGYTARLVLACDAVKKDLVAYNHYLGCLLVNCQRWKIPASHSKNPQVSVILPTYNGIHFTLASIASTARFLPKVSFELIVADNVSTDATEAILKNRKDIRYIRHPENLGFLRSCNRASRFANGEFVFLLNNDTLVAPGWLDELYDAFVRHDNVGLAGSKLIYPDGILQEGGGIIWKDGSAWNYGKFQDPGHPEFNYLREVDYCSGAAIMLPRRLWDEVGGFDEMYVPSYCEDSDLALRVRSLGYSVLYAPYSIISHFEGMTQGRDVTSGVKSFQVSNTEKLLDRWLPMISRYQPNGQQLQLAKDRSYTKRVLFLDECTPAPKEDAGSVTALNMMRLFQSRGYIVTFIPRSNYLYMNELTQEMQRDGIEVLYGHYVNSVADHLVQFGSRYDVVFMMRPHAFINHIDAIKRHAANARLIYHTCDLHYLRYSREAELTGRAETREMAEQFRQIEYRALKTAHASIVHSTLEHEVLCSDLPEVKSIHVFGWAIPVPTVTKPFDGRAGAVFVGGFNHQPNVDAVLFFVKEVLPLIWKNKPNFIFHIVGSKTPYEIKMLASSRVIVHGFVDNLEPLFEKVQVAVAPIRYGAGIKGKIATAMSVGLPNVVTSIGAEGMGLVDGQDCIIADRPAAIAAAVCKLAEDRVLWNRLSIASTAFCEQNYGATASGKIFDAILAEAGASFEYRSAPRLISPTGSSEAQAWPRPLRPMVRLSSLADWRKFAASPQWERAKARDRYARIRMHDRPETGYPALSLVTGRRERMVIDGVGLSDADGDMRHTITCPHSGLGNLDRLLARLVLDCNQRLLGEDWGLALRGISPVLEEWLSSSLTMHKGRGMAGLVVADGISYEAIASVAKGGCLIAAAPSVKEALTALRTLVEKGWSNVAIEVYHDPHHGHLGSDLFIVRAVR